MKIRKGTTKAEGHVSEVDCDEDMYDLTIELDSGVIIKLGMGYGTLTHDIPMEREPELGFPKKGDRVEVTFKVIESPKGRKNMEDD